MSRLAAILSILGGLLLPCNGLAQSAPLSGARLHASVEIDARGAFVYRYVVENGAGSQTGIARVTIDAPGAQLSAPQPGWKAATGADGTARWLAVGTSFILPKQRLAGFSMTSPAPPSLRSFKLVPHIDPDRAPIMPQGDDPGEADRYTQELEQYLESQSAGGTTLGPAPLARVSADTVLANLAGSVGQARSLRWISSDTVARSITEKVQAARAALSRNQLESASGILGALRTEVAGQSGKALTSEAIALVTVNIQYAQQLAVRR